MGSLEGKAALVTGGVSGIGGAITRALAARGCRVAYHGFRSSPEETGRQLEALGADALHLHGDLTDEPTARRIVETAAGHFGGLDVLVNNTGDLIGRRRLEEVDRDFLRTVLAVNLESMILVTKHAEPHLKRAVGGSSIVNVASLAGRKGGHDGSLVYSTAKGAVLTFTRSLASELAREGVRVNAVAPGLILGTSFHKTHTTDASARYTVEHQIPLARAGTPDDVARVVAFLASEYDGFVTGATLDVNGGQYMA